MASRTILLALAGLILLGVLWGYVRGGRRIGRLILAEGIKIVSHPFTLFALAVLVLISVATAHFLPRLEGWKVTEWAGYNAYLLFSYGARWGNVVASYILIGYCSVLFSSEFDRGTIKILLTRPVTRTDFFLGKVASSVLVALALYATVIYCSLFYGVSRGDLGAVWDGTQYIVHRTGDQMAGYLWKTIAVSFLPLVAVCFLGLFISNLSDSAVLTAVAGLIALFLLYSVESFLDPKIRMNFFTFYTTEGFDVLQRYAKGEGTLGYEAGHGADWFVPGRISEWFRNPASGSFRIALPLYVRVPLISMALFLLPAYALFRTKNVHA